MRLDTAHTLCKGRVQLQRDHTRHGDYEHLQADLPTHVKDRRELQPEPSLRVAVDQLVPPQHSPHDRG